MRASDYLLLTPAVLFLAAAAASLLWDLEPTALWGLVSLVSLTALVASLVIRRRGARQASPPPPM